MHLWIEHVAQLFRQEHGTAVGQGNILLNGEMSRILKDEETQLLVALQCVPQRGL